MPKVYFEQHELIRKGQNDSIVVVARSQKYFLAELRLMTLTDGNRYKSSIEAFSFKQMRAFNSDNLSLLRVENKLWMMKII